MEDFREKVAVVTGAASGIGLALARRACTEGMRVVLADIDDSGLRSAAGALERSGGRATWVVTDVRDNQSVEALADRAYAAFGAVHLLFNNAGITTAADNVEYAWNVPRGDWTSILQVNLWGVINGCLSFIPRMLAAGHQGHIVNTASSAGLSMGSSKGVTVYSVTKHAVVRLSEGLSKQLADAGSKLRVSVLCPSYVATRIVDSAFSEWTPGDNEQGRRAADLQSKIASGTDPAEIAAAVFRAIRRGWLHIIPHASVGTAIRDRFQAIIAELEEQQE
jgi:NAD(P)-dependent dehydrogenase (short-subunit alcohol dehydrogenase family)